MTVSSHSDRAWSVRGACSLSAAGEMELSVAGSSVAWCRPAGDPVESAQTTPRHGGMPWVDGQVLCLPRGWSFAPGFIDAHTHLLGVGMASRKPNLSAARSVDDAMTALASWLEANPGSSPVIGEGWDESAWPQRRRPLRADIDAVAPRRPVALRRVCGHVAVLNSPALATLGTDWPNLDESSGLALETLPLALNRLWPPVAADREAAALRGQEAALRQGVTWIQEMGHGHSFRAFGELAAKDLLRIRVSHYFNQEHFDAISELGWIAGAGDCWLRVAGIKFFLDGSIGGRSAAFREPYPQEGNGVSSAGAEPPPEVARSGGAEPLGGESGLLLWTDEDLASRLGEVAEGGYRAALHAIGDAAIEQAIRVVEGMIRGGKIDRRWGPRLEHAEALAPDLLERAEASGFWLSMQPNFTARWQGPGGLYEDRLGRVRTRQLNPYRSAAATGRLVLGSDCMPLSPWLGLWGTAHHPDEEERLPAAEGLAAYSVAARACVDRPFAEPWRQLSRDGDAESVFAAGDPADLVLLDDEDPPRVRAVAVAGRWMVWDATMGSFPRDLPRAAALLTPGPFDPPPGGAGES